MSRLLGFVLAGLTIGSVYALVSLGVVVIFRISRVVNLAHGAMGIFTTFVFHYVFVKGWGLPIWLAFLLTLGCGALLGVVVERLFVGPVRPDGILITVIMTVGVLLVLTELTVQFWGPNQPVIDSVFSDHVVDIGGKGVTVHEMATLACVAVLGMGLYLFLARTRYGAAIEAIAEDPGAARIVGLPVRRITTVTWALGGASASLAGMLYIHTNVLDQIGMTFVLVASLVAAVIGGFNSLGLAVAGSLGAGVLFSLAQGYVRTDGFGNVLVFVILVLALVAFRGRAAALESVSEY